MKPDRDEVMAEIKFLENELKAVEKDHNVLSQKFKGLIKRKSDLCEFIDNMRNEEDEAVGYISNNVVMLILFFLGLKHLIQ